MLNKLALASALIFFSSITFANNKCSEVFSKPQLFSPELLPSTLESLTGSSHSRAKNLLDYQKELFEVLEDVIISRSENIIPIPSGRRQKVRAKRNNFLETLYRQKVVKADPLSLALSDKLVFSRLVERVMGEKASEFHPKTRGLVSFLAKKGLIDPETGAVRADLKQLEKVFNKSFPDGFIIKPTSGWSSKGRTFFKDPMEVFEKLLNGEIDLYSAKEFFEFFDSPELGQIVSGERFIIQSLLGNTEGVQSGTSRTPTLKEYRVHSLWGQVIPEGVKGRWIGDSPTKKQLDGVSDFVQRFLDNLPHGFYQKQGWSFDIIELGQGRYAIVELNTNRGILNGHWSGSLHNPTMLGAYVRYLENHHGWRFKGWPGFLLRNGWGNRKRYKEHNRMTKRSHNGE